MVKVSVALNRMGASPYGEAATGSQYKTVAQIWKEASEQGSNYRTLSAKHRYNVVKNCSGDDFIPESEFKKIKSVGRGSFASGELQLSAVARRASQLCVE